jgi:hypothetical protein
MEKISVQRRFMRSALDTLAGVSRAAEYLRDTAPVHAAMLWRDERERAITCRHRRTQSPAAFILRSARFKKIERTTELNAQNKSREIQSEMCGKKVVTIAGEELTCLLIDHKEFG